jgi:DNA-binding MarR family transcriptional regulator
MGKVEGRQARKIIRRGAIKDGTMPNKRAIGAVSKLTEVEQDLLAQLEHGYRLETDSLGANPVLRREKDNELLRPDANASTVKALEERGLIRRVRGPDPLTIAWQLTKKAR